MEIRAYNIKQAAERLNLSVPFVRKLIKNKQLSYVRAGDRILISEKHLDDFLSHGTACPTAK